MKVIGNNVQKFKLLQLCKKETIIPEELERYLLQKQEVLFIEVRCIQLDPFEDDLSAKDENFRIQWPRKGYFSFNYKDGKEFVVPSESEFFRKSGQPDSLTLEGIGLERIRREEQIFDVSYHIKPGPNFIEIAKFDDPKSYVCAVYVTKLINVYDLCKFIRLHRVESFLESCERIRNHIASNTFFSKEQLNVRCPISQSRMKLPARGEKCTHLQCFEAENYLWINTKCKKWLCPICRKPAYNITVDTFMIQVIKKVNYIYPSDLGIENTKNKKEIIETLLAEINLVRKQDEQDEIVIDKNDIEYVTLNEDMSVNVGVRSFIPNPDIASDNYLIDFDPKIGKGKELSESNIQAIQGLREVLTSKAESSHLEYHSFQLPIHQEPLEIITIPAQIEETAINLDSDEEKQAINIESRENSQNNLNPEIQTVQEKQVQLIRNGFVNKRRKLDVAIGEIIDID